MADGGSVTIKVLVDTGDFAKQLTNLEKQFSSLSKNDPTKSINTGFSGSTKSVNLFSKAAGAANAGLKKIGSAAVSFGKVTIGAMAGATAAIAGLAISGGITRAMGINEAQAKMNQLGMDTSAIMANVKESVSGTRFALNDAAGAAVTLSSAGVAAGADMTNALKSVASTASISGAEFKEIGAIYSKVAAQGKLSTEVMNQLLERGVSVTAALSKKLGKTESDIKKMVTDGKIDFKTFSDAMYEYLGDASMSANTTFSGAMANVRAALSRTGEAFASPLLETFRKAFVDIIPQIDGVTASLAPLASNFAAFAGNAVSSLMGLVTWLTSSTDVFDEFGNKVGTAASPIQTFAEAIGSFFNGVISGIDFEGFAGAFQGVGDALGRVFGSDNQNSAATFGSTVANLINGFIPLIQMLTPFIEMLANVIKYVADNIDLLLPCAISMMAVISGLGLVGQIANFFNMFGNAVGSATPKMQINGVQMMQMAVAAMAMGAAILLAATGLYIFVQAAIQLAAAGPNAALALVGLVGAIAGLALLFAAIGGPLTAATFGMLAFGAAILMVGAGVLLACAGFTLLSGALPMISAYGMSAAGGLAALGGAMLIASAGAIALGGSLLLCTAGALGAGAGMLILAAGCMAAFLGLALCSAPSAILAPALMQAGMGAMMLGASLLIVAASSLAAAPGLLALAACIGGVALALGLATPAFAGLAGALGGSASSLSTCASSMGQIVSSCQKMLAASVMASAGMKQVGAASMVASTLLASACNKMEKQLSSLVTTVQSKISVIKAAFSGMQLHIPSPTLGKMPHFRLDGRFDLQAGTVPSINVDWYATGGYADKATIMGNWGFGEAGGEGIVPLEGKHMYPLADAMSERIGGGQADKIFEAIESLHRDIPAMLAAYCDIRLILNEREFGRAARNAKKQGWLDC